MRVSDHPATFGSHGFVDSLICPAAANGINVKRMTSAPIRKNPRNHWIHANRNRITASKKTIGADATTLAIMTVPIVLANLSMALSSTWLVRAKPASYSTTATVPPSVDHPMNDNNPMPAFTSGSGLRLNNSRIPCHITLPTSSTTPTYHRESWMLLIAGLLSMDDRSVRVQNVIASASNEAAPFAIAVASLPNAL